MERIASFCVDHTKLDRGMYLSRQDGDVLTWDIRMKKPNQGDYLTTGAAHTLEHLFATYARNSAYKDGVIYVGPMGCRTGFYLLRSLSLSALPFAPYALQMLGIFVAIGIISGVGGSMITMRKYLNKEGSEISAV